MKSATIILLCSLLFSLKLSSQVVIFSNQSNNLKFITGTMGQAKCGADMNSDGLDDVTRVSKDGIYIDFQNANGIFFQQYFQQAIKVLPVWSIAAGDLNYDGYNDLVFGGNSNVSFLVFDPITNKFIEQVLPETIRSQRTNFVDIDEDGDLDAFVCNDSGKSNTYNNDGTGTMILDHTLINTSPLSGNYSSIWVDYNNDGNTDLYISKCLAETEPGDERRTNLLYKNNGDKTFTEVGKIAGVDDNAQSWSTVFEDFDNDDDFDAFIINHDQHNRLYRNNGNGTFTDVIFGSGIDAVDFGAFENSAGDFNNDGYIDIISDLSNQLYLGNGDLTFVRQKLPFKAVVIGDFNNDGFLDATHRNELWINEGNENHWLKLNLIGVESNKNGIGIRAEIYGNWGKQIRELRSGQSFSPMHSLNVHFGLGNAEVVDSIIILWPSGIRTTSKNIRGDSTYTIVESICSLGKLTLPIGDQIMLCPGHTIQLEGPTGYEKYYWSDGSKGRILNVNATRNYSLIFEDSLGCRGFTNSISILEGDKNIPKIEIVSSDYPLCFGKDVTLRASTGIATNWSEGSKNIGEIVVTNPGLYYASIDSVCGNGPLVSKAQNVEFYEVPMPEVKKIKHLSNDSIQVSLEGDSCFWFNKFGAMIFIGCNNTLTNVTKDTTFFVLNQSRFQGIISSYGKKDTTGLSMNFSMPRKMYFTAKKPFILDSVDMFIKNSLSEGNRIIYLMNNNGKVLDSTMVNLVIGKNTVFVNFNIKQGQYQLACNRTDQLINIGSFDYPYPLSDFGQIDSSSVSLNFYPYFFNWQIKAPSKTCFSEGLALHISPSKADDLDNQLSVKFFPNPCSTGFYLDLDHHEDVKLLLYNLDGKLIKMKDYHNSEIIFMNVENIDSGYYSLKIISKNRTKVIPISVVH